MNMASALRHQAVNAAKNSDWDRAISLNQQILQQNPQDASAYNRLGVAYLQLNNVSKAQEAFTHSLSLDKTNSIAKKQLERLKSNHVVKAPAFSKMSFIEEPGKTKTVELHRLAGRQVLDQLSVGQGCQLKPKKRYISVEVDGQYVGALPEDLSYRLSKLIETGNEYSCSIRSCTNCQCMVYLKETTRSAENRDTHSFPPSKAGISSLNEVDESYLLNSDELPVEALDLDSDSDDATIEDVDENELDD